MVLSIREYDKLHIREKRDLTRNQISKDDAAVLQRLVIDDLPVFKWGNRCLIAQQWVGVIDLPEYSIEILPKLAREIENEKCRDILTRMLLVAHQSPSTRKLPGSVNPKKNALTEVLISAFLGALEIYIKSGVLNAYQKVQNNIDVVKGRIVFSKQFKQNVLSPTRFYCSYSKYISDNPVNQFLATCLSQMSCISRDNDNLRRIRAAEQYFEGVQILEVRKALNLKINFNSINSSAVESYNFGYMFLSCNFMTVNAGGIAMNVMLFDMNHLFELFMFKAIRQVYGSRVHYQSGNNYLVHSVDSGRKYIRLRPDIAIYSDSGNYIIDTKWKMPISFAKESDIYQMNAYSTGIGKVERVFLLYPKTSGTVTFSGDYLFTTHAGGNRNLGIRTIDLELCTNWAAFLNEIKALFGEI